MINYFMHIPGPYSNNVAHILLRIRLGIHTLYKDCKQILKIAQKCQIRSDVVCYQNQRINSGMPYHCASNNWVSLVGSWEGHGIAPSSAHFSHFQKPIACSSVNSSLPFLLHAI